MKEKDILNESSYDFRQVPDMSESILRKVAVHGRIDKSILISLYFTNTNRVLFEKCVERLASKGKMDLEGELS